MRHVDHCIGTAKQQQPGGHDPQIAHAERWQGIEQGEGRATGYGGGRDHPAITSPGASQTDNQLCRQQVEDEIAQHRDQHQGTRAGRRLAQQVGQEKQDGEIGPGKEQRLTHIAGGISEQPTFAPRPFA